MTAVAAGMTGVAAGMTAVAAGMTAVAARHDSSLRGERRPNGAALIQRNTCGFPSRDHGASRHEPESHPHPPRAVRRGIRLPLRGAEEDLPAQRDGRVRAL